MLPKFTTALLAFGLIGTSASAQLNIQSGATFVMQTGSQVTVQGDVQNAGTLTNDGNLKVQGNYANTGSYTGVGSAGVLEMYGTGNSTITPGASSISNLLINKTAAADVVKLMAATTVTNGFTLTNGVFTTDPLVTPAVALISPAATPYTFASGKEVVGSVKRTGWTAGAARVFNGTNMQVTTNGGVTPTDVTVTMIPQSGGGDPTQNEREVKRKFTFAQTGGSGFTADIRYPYLASELNTNTEANLVPWGLVAAEWNGRLTPVTRDAGNDWVATTGLTATQFGQEWKLADPNYTMNVTAALRGAWNGTAMTTTLNTSSLLPLAQPYNDPAFNNYNGGETVAAGFFAANPNIVDWVLVDFRKPASGLPTDATFANSIGRRAAFITSAGVVVDLDGVTPITVPITKQGNGFIVLKHRNHLPIMSNILPSNASGSYLNDFTLLASIYDNPALTSDPAQALPSSVKLGMWAGNAVRDGVINPGDIALVKANANVASAGYLSGDITLDGIVNPADIGLTKLAANGAAQSHTSRTGILRNNVDPASHVPN